MLAKLVNKLQTQVELAGLDIGSRSVKLVRLLKGPKGYTLSRAVEETITPAGENPSPAEAVLAAVKACLQKVPPATRNVVCGLEGSQVVVRGFKFPPLPEQAIAQAVEFEAQQVCPFDRKHSVLDYQLVEIADLSDEEKAAKAVRRHGLMVVTTHDAIQEKRCLIERAGGKTLMVDAGALAVLNCLNELALVDTTGTVAVIDLGWTYSNVIIYGHNGLPFVRDLNIAGRQVVESIASQLEMTDEQVSGVLSGGDDVSTETRNRVLLAMNNAIRPLATAVNETLRFHSFQEKGAGVEKIYLCGGFSLIDAFVEFLIDALPVDVALLNPFEKMTCQPGLDNAESIKTCGPAWVTAIGLAMRTI